MHVNQEGLSSFDNYLSQMSDVLQSKVGALGCMIQNTGLSHISEEPLVLQELYRETHAKVLMPGMASGHDFGSRNMVPCLKWADFTTGL